MQLTELVDIVVEVAKTVGKEDQIDASCLTYDSDTAYSMIATSVVETHLKDHPGYEVDLVVLGLLGTLVHVTLENMTLHHKIIQQ